MIEDLRTLTNCDDTNILSLLVNQCKLVCQRFNKLSADGISSQSYSGISESYTDDFSPMIYKSLRKHRKLRTV